jgi:hypothetical protein
VVEAAQRALLRQLGLGFGVHRLYPGAVDADAFVAAAQRVEAGVAAVLAAGATSIEVRAGRFLVGGRPVEDETTRRLATACYARRIEHLRFERPPDRHELARWYEVLSRDPHELEEAGGVAAALQTAQVSAIRAAEGSPEPAAGDELAEELLDLADWVETVQEEPTAEEVAELVLQPGETGETLYARLRELSDRILSDGTVRSTFFRRAAWLVDELEPPERARFGRLVIDAVGEDGFAERFAGHLNDLALATLVVTVAHHEHTSPFVLAEQVGREAERHATLLRLVEAIEDALRRRDAKVDGATSWATDPHPAGVTVDADLISDVVVDLAGEHRELVESFPEDALEGRDLAMTALVDVMHVGPRDDQCRGIVDNVIAHLRTALVAGDTESVTLLLDVLSRAREVGGPGVVAEIDRGRRGALDPAVLADAARTLAREGRQLGPELLEPFGSHAIDPLVGAVGGDVSEATSQHLASLVATVGRAHPATLEDAIARQRPDVVARLVPVVANDEAALPLLGRLAQRGDLAILNSVVEAAAKLPARAAAPVVASAARRAPTATLQRRCLDVLAHQGAQGREQLLALASDTGNPRLPWAKRRTAKHLARRGRGT